MKLFIVAAFALFAVVAAQDRYTTKYDGVDLDEILKSDRLFNNYFKCLMDQGRCTPDGNELKRVLPDALKTDCAKCSEKQKSGTQKVVNYLIDNRANQWKSLQAKYDPDNVYVNKYRSEAKKAGIKV
uniref:Protein serine/threonine kinase n=1 Tax=Psorophora albipes TaxID=869069 RepID=T1E2M0_9DIPT